MQSITRVKTEALNLNKPTYKNMCIFEGTHTVSEQQIFVFLFNMFGMVLTSISSPY